MSLWFAPDAARAMASEIAGEWHAHRVVTDSRKIAAGDLFVALKGERFDGHDFVAEVLTKGAVAAVVENGFAAEGTDPLRLIRADDPLSALQALGAAGRARSSAKVIGVTGSVGKTSCKEALRLVCADQARTYASEGNLNNHIGLPLMLANLPVDTEIAVIEMGMNHAGEIALLSKLAKPDVAIITAVEAAHLEFFADVGEIADAKAEICAGMPTGGTLAIPADNPYADRLRTRAAEWGITDIRSFGASGGADVWLVDYRAHDDRSEVLLAGAGGERGFTLGAVGRHWAVMAAGCFAVIGALGLDAGKAASSFARFHEPKGRGNAETIRLSQGSVTILDDSYNASPASMRAAFARLAEIVRARGRGRALACLGDMRELGEDAARLHRELSVDLVRHKVDKLYAAGPLMRNAFDAVPESMRGLWRDDAAALSQALAESLEDGDVLLVKGSRGSRMERVIAALRASTPTEKPADAL